MTLKKLISIVNKVNVKFGIIKKIITVSLYSFIFLFSLTFIYFDTPSVEASVMKNDKLIERISKDYTNKFCNSIAFGLSKESAMNFAIKRK